MNYVIENDKIKVAVSDLGAELQSIYGKTTNFEYLWQGHNDFWKGKAVNVFPICGRLYGGKYTYKGKEYSLPCHGFVGKQVFEVKEISDKKIVFFLKNNKETEENYPFEFEYKVVYSIDGATLKCEFFVENTGIGDLPFSLGGHPGFNVPLANGLDFIDHYLEFDNACAPEKLLLSDTCFCLDKTQPFELKNNKVLSLKHELFDNDAIFLVNMDKAITLKSDKTERFIKVAYSNMKYLGFWHTPKSQAPFVCIEPWTGIPSTDGIVDDFESKNEFTRLKPNDTFTANFTVTVNE